MFKRPPCPTLLAALLLALLLGAGGCAKWQPFAPAGAEATLLPVKDGKASGLMRFRKQEGELLIQGTFTGLAPGSHGLHIHEGHDCGGPEARNAGAHLNPTGARHGDPGRQHHLGDLPMVTAGQDGTARFQARMGGMSLDESPAGILRRAVIVTARPDDFTTQPSGNSGPAVACGVIQPSR